jgi:hypothetical protein
MIISAASSGLTLCDRAEHARRLATLTHQSGTEMLQGMAENFEEIADDPETGAVDVRHPELLSRLRRDGWHQSFKPSTA